MNGRESQDYLTTIAYKIHKLINIEANKDCFQKHIAAFRKARNTFAQALKEAKKAAIANPDLRYDYDEFRDKDKDPPKPPKEGYKVERHYVLDDYPKGFWRPELPFNPDSWLSRFQCKWFDLFHPPGEEPRNKDEMLMCEFALIATIRDEALNIPECDRLTDFQKDDWVQTLWADMSNEGLTADDRRTYAERMRNIKTAFNNVLANLPAETGEAKVLKGQAGLNTENTLNSELKKDNSVFPSLNEKEQEKLFSGVEKKHPAQKFFEDIMWGDVKAPTKFDKFIVQKTNDTEIFVKSQIARLGKVSAYIGRQIRRWVEEKVVDDIAEWYERWDQHPFTSRLMSIEQPCKEVEGILARRLSALRGDFKAGYEKMLKVANQCDIERTKYRGALPTKPISDFRSAAAEFHEIVNIIHVEANVELDKLTKAASDSAGGTDHGNKVSKKPSKEAIQAYRLFGAVNSNQTEVAKLMSDNLKRTISQGQISKWNKECKAFLKANGLAGFASDLKPDIVTIDPVKLDMGARTDGKRTGDPKHKKLVDPDNAAYDD